MVLDVRIVGTDAGLSSLIDRGANCFAVGVGSVGVTGIRERLFHQGSSHKLEPLTVVHPSAIVSTWAQIGPGSQVMATCVVNAGASIGLNAIFNTGAIIKHNCVIRDHVDSSTVSKL